MKLHFPSGKDLPDYGGATGKRLDADTSRTGIVDDGSLVSPARLELARRTWPEARREDFEQVDRRGRRFRDRATDAMFEALPGAALLSIGREETRGASCFFVSGGRITVLRPAGYREPLYGHTPPTSTPTTSGRQAPSARGESSDAEATPVVGDSSEEVLAG